MNKQQTQNHKVYFNDFGFVVYSQSGALWEREANPIREMKELTNENEFFLNAKLIQRKK